MGQPARNVVGGGVGEEKAGGNQSDADNQHDVAQNGDILYHILIGYQGGKCDGVGFHRIGFHQIAHILNGYLVPFRCPVIRRRGKGKALFI